MDSKQVTLRMPEMVWVLLRETLRSISQGIPLELAPEASAVLIAGLDDVREFRRRRLEAGDWVTLPTPNLGDTWTGAMEAEVIDVVGGLLTVRERAGGSHIISLARVMVRSIFAQTVEVGPEEIEIHRDPVSGVLFGVDANYAEFNEVVGSPYAAHSIQLASPE